MAVLLGVGYTLNKLGCIFPAKNDKTTLGKFCKAQRKILLNKRKKH